MDRFTIWRYLSTDKFEKLINDNGLYFSRASDFDDKREGHYTLNKYYEELRASNHDMVDSINSAEEMTNRIRDNSSSTNYISCWHKNEKENIDMWDSYTKNSNEGVVIKSNIIQIIEMVPHSLSEVITPYDCVYGEKDDNDDYTNNFQYKDIKYSYENEFRLVIDNHQLSILTPFSGHLSLVTRIGDKLSHEVLGHGKNPKNDILKKGNGLIVKYNLNKIINEIRVKPKSSDEYMLYIKNKMKEAGLTCPLNHSELE
ncbi:MULTISPECIES: hypothetical protein [Pectobacterium]|uniref:hypothetical protein n=1 Tax=Pectobacterium TaxID=122277 RepID=UPI001968B2AD|nr:MULTISPECIES: hypothetical protein [Pectobacterium]QSD45982.1 hypothetical protein H5A39_10420 [Pectobacterium brasiliense]